MKAWNQAMSSVIASSLTIARSPFPESLKASDGEERVRLLLPREES